MKEDVVGCLVPCIRKRQAAWGVEKSHSLDNRLSYLNDFKASPQTTNLGGVNMKAGTASTICGSYGRRRWGYTGLQAFKRTSQ